MFLFDAFFMFMLMHVFYLLMHFYFVLMRLPQKTVAQTQCRLLFGSKELLAVLMGRFT